MIIPTIKAEPPTITTVRSPQHKPIIVNRAPKKRVANIVIVFFIMLFLDPPKVALAAWTHCRARGPRDPPMAAPQALANGKFHTPPQYLTLS